MNIKIAQRLRPFSHQAGSYAHIPGSPYRARIYPTRFVVEDVSGRQILIKDLPLTGPVDEFTVQLDLEKGDVVVWGRAKEGFYRYRLRASTQGVAVVVEKMPKGVTIEHEAGELYLVPKGLHRLSLGSHKSQEWEQICRRADFAEIFPLWHRLGQMIPEGKAVSVLDKCKQAIAERDAQHVLDRFREVFVACFDGMLAPRLADTNYHGIALPETKDASPLALLAQGSQLIQSMFVQAEGNKIGLLPVLPPEFHSGRILDVECGKVTVSIEWTKKVVRRVSLQPHEDVTVSLSARNSQKSCRIHDHDKRYTLGSDLSLVAGKIYWLDNFQS